MSRTRDQLAIGRILKVNHAGEYGAIRIYGAQIFIAKILFKDLVPYLDQMRKEEIEHCDTFRAAMSSRNTHPCATMWVWGKGGFLLGLITAFWGRNAIMVCTQAIEEAVHHHMSEQIRFLEGKDEDLQKQIERIKVEELQHLDFARLRVRHTALTKAGYRLIYLITELLIWLSTQGALSRMKRDLGCPS